MRLGDILVAQGLVSLQAVEQAVDRQKVEGGRLGENLVALGLLTAEQLEDVLHETPVSPKTVASTGIPLGILQSLMLKMMYVEQRESPARLAEGMRLPYNVIKTLLDDAVKKKYVQSMGTEGEGGLADIRYTLSERGRQESVEALNRSLYIGPAPVSLTAYQERTLQQRISNEQLNAQAVRDCFSDLIVPEHFIRKIGPAVNSGHTMLLYGQPGNGKTSIATRLAQIFQHIIYVPHCVEIDGYIMQIYDAAIHKLPVGDDSGAVLARQSEARRREDFDQRWVACRRPIVVVGGELTLDMLDLTYSEDAKFYEAPMHVKALNGTFIVDDFGRQLVSPEHLLNRWIVPMESRIDFFKLHTGKSFQIPYDQLLIFSTNLEPDDLMDPAFLRRIRYKIELYEPNREDYRKIFEAVSRHARLELPDDIFDYVVDQLQVANDIHLAYYQPKFIVDQVIAACKYEGIPPSYSRERVSDALRNLYVRMESAAKDVEQEQEREAVAPSPAPAPASAPASKVEAV
ncbi:MAG: ATP-binding protein [Alphaproteobacteria bacterium]